MIYSSTRLTTGGGHNLYFRNLDITGTLLPNKGLKARSVPLSRAVMRNFDVIFTVMKCVHPYRHYLHIKHI